mmetsp:Transcript_6304/g.10462  ORF Transcript_6304/g.10462 Transcript_6304/m.10462 type:complete len:312 (-) Transcript_6304:55-990(-)
MIGKYYGGVMLLLASSTLITVTKARSREASKFLPVRNFRRNSDRIPLRAPNLASFAPGQLRNTRRRVPRLSMMAAENEEQDQDQFYARQLAEEVMEEQGVDLEQLMSPMKAIRLYKEVAEKTEQIANVDDMSTRALLQEELETALAKLAIEKRSVMREELKQVFLIQSLLSIGISGMLATNHFPGYPDLPVSAQALGFWTIWLFTIPSLRARKPAPVEKEALNIAFLLTPVLNIAIPFVAKDPGLIWLANVVAIAASYAYAFLAIDEESARESGLKIQGAARWLDWGSGQERGAPKEVREELEKIQKERRE